MINFITGGKSCIKMSVMGNLYMYIFGSEHDSDLFSDLFFNKISLFSYKLIVSTLWCKIFMFLPWLIRLFKSACGYGSCNFGNVWEICVLKCLKIRGIKSNNSVSRWSWPRLELGDWVLNWDSKIELCK